MSPFWKSCISFDERQRFVESVFSKNRKRHIPPCEYRSYLLTDEIVNDIEAIVNGNYRFQDPERITAVINGKTRQLYRFSHREEILLSFINYMLHHFDDRFSKNLYSGISGRPVNQIPERIRCHPGISDCYCCRTDIHSYGTSIDRNILISRLRDFMPREPELLEFLILFINLDSCTESGRKCRDAEAVKMGTPLTAFFENLYMSEIDSIMEQKAGLYIRYCDDIIIYDKTLSGILELKKIFLDEISKLHLEVNPKADRIFSPGEFVDFVGYTLAGSRQQLPLSVALYAKSMVRARCRTLLNLRRYHHLNAQNAMILMALYNNRITEELKVHFKNVTETDVLRDLDRYMADSVRFAGLGKCSNTASKYRIKYEEIKESGYKSLVNEYFRFKNAGHL